MKMECLRLLATFSLNLAKQKLISGFVDTYLRLNPQELVEFEAEIAKLNLEEKEAVFKITTSWEEKGKAEGLLTGLRAPLRMRFGNEGLAFLATLGNDVGLDVLERITDQVDSAPDLACLRQIAAEKLGSRTAGDT